MPIPGGQLAPPVLTPPPEPVGAYDFRLSRADGSLFVLNSAVGIEVQAGAQGLDDPTLDLIEHTPAGWDGSMLDAVAAEPREVFLPLLLTSTTLMGLRTLKQSLTSYLNPRRGPVTLRVGIPDGSGRLLDGYYRPVPGTMDTDTWGVSWQKLGIVVHATQPFWRSEAPWTVEWALASSSTSPLPILPLQPASSSVLGGTNPVTIAGDVATHPVWRITGPLEVVTITDVALGNTFTFTQSVADGDVWTIDTRRGRQGVFAPDGTRQRATLNAGAALFPLQPGLSQIETVVTGASGGAKVTGEAPILWLSA